MSGIAALSAAAVVTTAATVVAATLPEARDLFAPLTEGGGEYVVGTISVLASFPLLAVLTTLVVTGRD